MERRIFFLLFHIFQRLRHYFFGGEHDRIIRHGFVILRCGAVEELRLCPERAYRKTFYLSVTQFNVQRTGIVQNKCFRRAVNIDVRNRLKCGDGAELIYLPSLAHIRKRCAGHQHDRTAVQVYHIRLIFWRYVGIFSEFAETARIDKHGNIGFIFFKQSLVFFKGIGRCQIHRNGSDAAFQLL